MGSTSTWTLNVYLLICRWMSSEKFLDGLKEEESIFIYEKLGLDIYTLIRRRVYVDKEMKIE